ncbi:uncharacterized protein PV09_07716 [Verruconis gallopava]|uniref:F5/8 type C domain-containing protein n=1 Tax=Verruconis gallopava TaxID=253628 RepID=A0A0D1XEU8_9PEZI|nr:uncharacterized protein PV09_07716 [Verruconis gallopava]KIW00731.1 hypothetical protein PV09_07716 [Verruconis gallopava]
MFQKSASFLALVLGVLNLYTVSAAVTTALAPIPISREGWLVTTDSFQPGNPATNAIDDNAATFWHTAYNPDAPLPHWILVDMRNQYVVNGFSYTPRQDGNSNGNIGTHTIEYSLDGNTWTTAATGTWANDPSVKTTLFTPVIARYMRLTATTEASNTGKQWSSAAEINVLTNPHAAVARANWKVTADSQETSVQSWPASAAIDGSPNTFWHSQWVNAQPPLPHYFTIDQGTPVNVGGLSYVPRPASSGPNGRIGSYQVQKSDDGNTWTTIATGTWADTMTQKFVEWTPITARYFRLVALTEAGNRGPWTSAAEINLLDGSNNLANFIVTVDSQETAAVNNSAVLALDGDPTTFWHTEWSQSQPGFPHTFQIDMQATLPVKALQYLPRQDGNFNGNIGQYRIDLSSDGNTWTTVSTGQFADNSQAKLVQFQETTCRYVRLTALSEAGNRGPWSSAAEILVSFDATYVAPNPKTYGQWGMTIDFPVVPVAAAVTYDTGGVLAWAAWNPLGNGWENTVGGVTVTALYNPSTGIVSKAAVSNTQHDMFCPGINMDHNGQIVVTGGNDAPRTSIYQTPNAVWFAAPNMQQPRGYQAATTLSNGWTFTIGGSWSGGIYKKNGEYYNPATNTWTMLNGADVTPMLTADTAGLFRQDNHAWLFAWKNQAVFQAGPSKAMNWYTTTGNGGVTSAGTRSDATDQMCGFATMYDAVNGKVLAAGGSPNYSGSMAVNNAYIITIPGTVGAQAQVQKVAPMSFKRIFANGVALPNGQVFVVGGQDFGSPFNDDSSIMYPELYTPSTNTWTTMGAMAVPRNYHSIALLMPDATVMVGGGGLCDGCDYNHYDGQIWQPPYLFDNNGNPAVRPVIKSVSATTIKVGKAMSFTADSVITSIALVRLGSATHTVNTDQRRIPITPAFTGVTSYSFTIPSDPGIALPGYWMLFAMNSAGVPSLSKTIKITL